MAADEPHPALSEELRMIDERLAELRQELEGLQDDLRDADDSAAAITLVEEQQALIETLEARRAELRRQLGEG
jgi:chromosome segregation ATPase